MTNVLNMLIQQKAIKDHPKWLPDNVHYQTVMGSQAYGVTQDTSDMDVYGWVIPPIGHVFPHRIGYIGLGPVPDRFDQWQLHHVKSVDGKKEYDFSIYNVVKYMQLVMENNPNMIDSIFTPVNCVLHCTTTGQVLRDNRRKFLHKGAFHKFKGYAYAQMHKIRTMEDQPKQSDRRRESIEKFGFDTKFAYHVVRLLNECEQILEVGDLDLQQNNEQLKAIRRGEMTLEEIQKWFASKELHLNSLYEKSTLPHGPDWKWGSSLLLNILEAHYGTISDAVATDHGKALLSELQALVDKFS
ncbi:putative nucleotidyltransferase protein [Rhizobium phage RHph_I1_18]|nr:putative nucleotidyltransferase protein [Rhizobium phage RHph_I1_18]